MKWHPEVLEAVQKEVLCQLGPVMARWGFYLGGGTALALYLGHRLSVDLDWFTPEPLDDPLGLARRLVDEGLQFTTGQVARGTLHGFVSGVRVSFLEYRYPLLEPISSWSEGGCTIASLDDLVCMKLSAVAQRGSRKDFVDVYALGIKHRSLSDMLKLYKKKFGIDDIAHILYGLSYFDDAEQEQMPKMLWDISWETVKATIRQWVKEIMNVGGVDYGERDDNFAGTAGQRSGGLG